MGGFASNKYRKLHYFFHKINYRATSVAPSQYFLFNAMADDLKNECKKMDKFITEKGGIDIMIVGIGMNGHIGFNEPGLHSIIYHMYQTR